MAKVENVLLKAFVFSKLERDAKTFLIITLFKPLGKGPEEPRFKIIETKVILFSCDIENTWVITVCSEVRAIHKVHWRRTSQCFCARTVCAGRSNAGFQLVDVVMSTICIVGKAQWMKVVECRRLNESKEGGVRSVQGGNNVFEREIAYR